MYHGDTQTWYKEMHNVCKNMKHERISKTQKNCLYVAIIVLYDLRWIFVDISDGFLRFRTHTACVKGCITHRHNCTGSTLILQILLHQMFSHLVWLTALSNPKPGLLSTCTLMENVSGCIFCPVLLVIIAALPGVLWGSVPSQSHMFQCGGPPAEPQQQ